MKKILILEVVQNGGAKLAPELRKRLMDTLGCTFQEVFGTAEGLLYFTRLDDPEEMILTSSGCPLSPGDEVKVVDDSGKELPPGEVGELVCRGPYTVHGYYNSLDHNKQPRKICIFAVESIFGEKGCAYVTQEDRDSIF